MEDIKIFEAVEQYINGKMNTDERIYFEQLRKTNPEVDQLVVEQIFFMQQMNRFNDVQKFKNRLNEVHVSLAEKGIIKSPQVTGKAKIIYLFNRYKRVAAIAASIAGITALTISAFVWSLSPGKPVKDEIQALSREIKVLKNQNKQLDKEIDQVKQTIPAPAFTYKTGGTSFLIDTKGILVTNAHIVQKASQIAVQDVKGNDFHAELVFVDVVRDLAILKIIDTAYKAPAALPYGIRRTTADIAEPIFTLGFPRNDIVYGEGYLSANTGFNGDTLTCQIAIAANPGNSGGPVINKYGEVIGVLSTRQTTAVGVVFATQSKYIYQVLHQLQKDTAYQHIKIPATSSLKKIERMQQVKKISDYIYMVKVN
ncbi:MAG: serine protease [Chitinophagaceae bacterium]